MKCSRKFPDTEVSITKEYEKQYYSFTRRVPQKLPVVSLQAYHLHSIWAPLEPQPISIIRRITKLKVSINWWKLLSASSICSFVKTNGAYGNDPDLWSSLWIFWCRFAFAMSGWRNLFKAFSCIITTEEFSEAFPAKHLYRCLCCTAIVCIASGILC